MDEQKVMKGLKICVSGECSKKCPYINPNNNELCDLRQLLADALALLQEKGA